MSGLNLLPKNSEVALVRSMAAQAVLRFDPETLLPISLAAPLLCKSAGTLSVDVTRRPHLLPPFLRVGGRILFRLRDVQAFINGNPAVPTISTTSAAKRGRGRPRKLEVKS